jgi:hypothetical protein
MRALASSSAVWRPCERDPPGQTAKGDVYRCGGEGDGEGDIEEAADVQHARVGSTYVTCFPVSHLLSESLDHQESLEVLCLLTVLL